MDKLNSSIIIKHTSDGRPTFGWPDSKEPIRACGLVFCYTDQHGPAYLIRKEKKDNKMVHCDIGGKTDPEDTCILNTLTREVSEETNSKLFGKHGHEKCQKLLLDVLNSCELKLYYSFKSKYLVIKIIADYKSLPKHLKYFKNLPMKRFGKIEKTTQMEHQYKWIRKVNKNSSHVRLQNMFDEIFND